MEKKLLLTITVIILTFGSFYTQAQSWSGSGTSSNPYLITNPAELEALAIEVNGGDNFYGRFFKLTIDVDLSAFVNTNAFGGIGWTPIGGSTDLIFLTRAFFEGNFDGNGHKITNITIDDLYGIEIGLFGYVGQNGVIKNLNLETSEVGISFYFDGGGIAGCNEGTITNCSSKGKLTYPGFDGGLLVGYNKGIIENCFSDGTITDDALMFIGGLVGYNEGSIRFCNSAGSINISSGGVVGGLVGGNDGNIEFCFSTCTVVNNSINTGGLVGQNGSPFIIGTIKSCYSTGSVSGLDNCGGLVGENFNDNNIIESCYSTSSVNGSENIGGLIGQSYGGSITSCYSTGLVNGDPDYTGGLVGFINSFTPTISNCFSIPYIGADSIYIGEQSLNKPFVEFINRESTGLVGSLRSLPSGNWSVSPNNYPYLSNLPIRTLNVIDAPYLSVNVNYGIVANEIINPTRYGYDFIDGWFIGGGSKYDFSQIVYQDIDLYGDWYLIPTLIIEQPESAVLCLNTNGIHTFNVRATGTDVTYQWYKNGQPIQNAINSWYEATNIIDDYSADFYVRASGFGGAVTSQEVNVRAINPLPAVLEFEETPSTNRLTTKQDYVFSVKDYMDVRDWLWTSSSGNVILSASEGSKSITARFIQTGQDTIHVTFVQACTSGVGYKSISFPVTIENATDNENIDNTSLSVYPNPTNGRVTVSGLTEGEEISLYNFSGSKVKSYISTGSVMKIDLSVLPNGIYLLRTSSGVAKVIKN